MPSKLFISVILGCSIISSPLAHGEDRHKSITEMTLEQYLADKNLKVRMGHCRSGNTSQPEFLQTLVEENPEVKLIAEVGFNAGHSSDIFLKSGENTKVVSFDLGKYRYTNPAKEFIDQNYPERHTLIKGDSRKTIPKFIEENEEMKFDLIFIDGGHSYDCAIKDITNMKAMAHKDTILIIDDVRMKGVMQATEECIENELITEIETIRSKRKSWTICRNNF